MFLGSLPSVFEAAPSSARLARSTEFWITELSGQECSRAPGKSGAGMFFYEYMGQEYTILQELPALDRKPRITAKLQRRMPPVEASLRALRARDTGLKFEAKVLKGLGQTGYHCYLFTDYCCGVR